jgi:hypothetical protein
MVCETFASNPTEIGAENKYDKYLKKNGLDNVI